jgi:UDP-galactopyranose mutase
MEPRDLAASVTSRIPIRTNRDNRYFSDVYQGIPKHGYTAMFQSMLSHKNISVLLQTDYRSIVDSVKFDRMIYTGPIDEFFDRVHGPLPYRSLRFEHEIVDRPVYQGFQQINYPNEFDFTRIVEWKHATGQVHQQTLITREYPLAATDGLEKYYPIPREDNELLFKQYKTLAESLGTVTFCGRLADYRYYNMDQVIARALMVFRKEIVR